jgi:hypothetical protein
MSNYWVFPYTPPALHPGPYDDDDTPPSDDAFTLTDLIAAKKFVEMIGSPRRAMSLLDALDKLS